VCLDSRFSAVADVAGLGPRALVGNVVERLLTQKLLTTDNPRAFLYCLVHLAIKDGLEQPELLLVPICEAQRVRQLSRVHLRRVRRRRTHALRSKKIRDRTHALRSAHADRAAHVDLADTAHRDK